MRKHRNPRPSVSQPDNFDIPAAIDLLREVIARTDALAYATEQHFERFGWRCLNADDSEHPLERLAHLLGAARESAAAAVSLGATSRPSWSGTVGRRDKALAACGSRSPRRSRGACGAQDDAQAGRVVVVTARLHRELSFQDPSCGRLRRVEHHQES